MNPIDIALYFSAVVSVGFLAFLMVKIRSLNRKLDQLSLRIEEFSSKKYK